MQNPVTCIGNQQKVRTHFSASKKGWLKEESEGERKEDRQIEREREKSHKSTLLTFSMCKVSGGKDGSNISH